MLSVKRQEDLCSPAKKAKLEVENETESAENQTEPKPELRDPKHEDSTENINEFVEPKTEFRVAKSEDESEFKSDLEYKSGEIINLALLDAMVEESIEKQKFEEKVKKEIISIDDSDDDGGVKQISRKNLIDFTVDKADELKRRKLGLPASFEANFATAAVDSKSKKTFACLLCNVTLNRQDSLISHENGSRHQKKLVDQTSKSSLLTSTSCPRLIDRLGREAAPIVGLRFVREIIACSDAKAGPQYDCTLCKKQASTDGMVSHILGRLHRENFLKNKYPASWKYLDIKPQNSLLEIGAFRENGNLELKETLYSDELYTWTTGKAPWSLEKGGTGIPPTSLRLKPTEKSWKDFSEDFFPEITTLNDARKALDASQKLVKKFETFFCPVVVHDGGIASGLESNSDSIRKSFLAFQKLISAKELKDKSETKSEVDESKSSSKS